MVHMPTCGVRCVVRGLDSHIVGLALIMFACRRQVCFRHFCELLFDIPCWVQGAVLAASMYV